MPRVAAHHAACHGWIAPLVRDQQARGALRAQAVDARCTGNAPLGGAENGEAQPMDTGIAQVLPGMEYGIKVVMVLFTIVNVSIFLILESAEDTG